MTSYLVPTMANDAGVNLIMLRLQSGFRSKKLATPSSTGKHSILAACSRKGNRLGRPFTKIPGEEGVPPC